MCKVVDYKSLIVFGELSEVRQIAIEEVCLLIYQFFHEFLFYDGAFQWHQCEKFVIIEVIDFTFKFWCEKL